MYSVFSGSLNSDPCIAITRSNESGIYMRFTTMILYLHHRKKVSKNLVEQRSSTCLRITVESKKSLKKIANFGKVKNAIFSKKMLKIES